MNYTTKGYKLIVGILSPASDYLRGFVRLLTELKLWRKRVAIVASKAAFARAVAMGFERAAGERAARRRGVRIRVKWNGAFDPDDDSRAPVPRTRAQPRQRTGQRRQL